MGSSHHDTGLLSVTMARAAVFGQAQHLVFAAFPNSKIKSYLKGSKFQESEEIQENADCPQKNKAVPGMLPSMEMTLDKVCGFRRGLLSRRLNGELLSVIVFFFL